MGCQQKQFKMRLDNDKMKCGISPACSRDHFPRMNCLIHHDVDINVENQVSFRLDFKSIHQEVVVSVECVGRESSTADVGNFVRCRRMLVEGFHSSVFVVSENVMHASMPRQKPFFNIAYVSFQILAIPECRRRECEMENQCYERNIPST